MAKPRPEKTPWFKRWVWKSILLFALIAAFLGGVIAAGRWALEQQRDKDRYDVAFLDIECDPPAGMSKQDFLAEVRYVAPTLPQKINLLDDDAPGQLRSGFLLHPWVEKVDNVEFKPPKQIIVKLTHRTPVLAVKVDGELRALDGHGVLLRKNAPTEGLPVYPGDAKTPGAEGKRWGDPNLEAAARRLRPGGR